jgi:hypothetical protein
VVKERRRPPKFDNGLEESLRGDTISTTLERGEIGWNDEFDGEKDSIWRS